MDAVKGAGLKEEREREADKQEGENPYGVLLLTPLTNLQQTAHANSKILIAAEQRRSKGGHRAWASKAGATYQRLCEG